MHVLRSARDFLPQHKKRMVHTPVLVFLPRRQAHFVEFSGVAERTRQLGLALLVVAALVHGGVLAMCVEAGVVFRDGRVRLPQPAKQEGQCGVALRPNGVALRRYGVALGRWCGFEAVFVPVVCSLLFVLFPYPQRIFFRARNATTQKAWRNIYA